MLEFSQAVEAAFSLAHFCRRQNWVSACCHLYIKVESGLFVFGIMDLLIDAADM
jgi:hypothetical protein